MCVSRGMLAAVAYLLTYLLYRAVLQVEGQCERRAEQCRSVVFCLT